MRYIPGVPYAPPDNPPPRPLKPEVVFQPKTYQAIKTGVDWIANAIRPTLGPFPKVVMFEKFKSRQAPELLDDGATIARRIIQIQPRTPDVGAMLIRNALWKMHTEAGDGTTTMGVIYQAIVREGIRSIIQMHANPMLLRPGLEKGLEAILECLRRDTQVLTGKENIARIAQGMCQEDPEMADMLGEIFDILGPEGMIVVEGWQKTGIEREYIEGTYWHLCGWYSRLLVTDLSEMQTVFEDAALFISNMEFQDVNQLVPVLDACARAGVKRLVILGKEFSDAVIGLLVSNNQAKTIETLAVKTPKYHEMDQVAAMEDISVLTGGKVFYAAAKENLENFKVEDLGHARRAWATQTLFGIYGGKGDLHRLRQYTNQLRRSIQEAREDDYHTEEYQKDEIRKRIARLLGGAAILRVGGLTDTARETRKIIAERAVAGLRNAVQNGVVPGGGVALLKARSILKELIPANEDEGMAYNILAKALEEPVRAIAENAGHNPDVIIDRLKDYPDGYGFDAREEKYVDLRASGIVDAALVIEKALQIAVSGAAIALTTDVIIHHRKPVESLEP
jgi:chaperonin GroEL